MGRTSRKPGGRMRRVVGKVLLAVVLAVLVLPLFLPIPEAPGVADPKELAGADSRFIDIGGLWYHYELAGEAPCTVLFLHSFAASTFSWRDVVPEVAERCTAIAFDRPAFGLTDRPRRHQWDGPNPYSITTQADHTIELMDALGIERAVLVGHSAGGTVAVLAAARHPERVSGLVLEAPAIYDSGGPPEWLRVVLSTPHARRIGPLFVRRAFTGSRAVDLLRQAWADPSLVTDEVIEGYRRPLEVEGWDRALWEFTIAPRPDDPAEALARVVCPVLVIAGTEDRIVPYEDSVRVAQALDAQMVSFENTGHLPHEEQPERFVDEINRFLGNRGVVLR